MWFKSFSFSSPPWVHWPRLVCLNENFRGYIMWQNVSFTLQHLQSGRARGSLTDRNEAGLIKSSVTTGHYQEKWEESAPWEGCYLRKETHTHTHKLKDKDAHLQFDLHRINRHNFILQNIQKKWLWMKSWLKQRIQIIFIFNICEFQPHFIYSMFVSFYSWWFFNGIAPWFCCFNDNEEFWF